MPTPVITLPKVAKYITNVGKSIKLASIDYIADSAPNTAEFLETNNELFKEIYSATKNYKQTLRNTKKIIQRSKAYDALMEGKKALFEDLKSGNWYNKEREEAFGFKALDMEFDDMDSGFDESLFSFDDDDTSDAAKSSRIIDASITASTKAQASITVKSADYIAETVRTSNNLLFAQNERLMAQMTSGMGSIHAAVGDVSRFMEGPMMTHFQNTKTYQEKSLEHFANLEGMIKEMLEMNRNLYKVEQEERKDSQFADVFDYDGIPDLKNYGKTVWKNIRSYLGPEADMLFGDTFGKDSNPLLLMMASPLKSLSELVVKSIIPVTIKKSIEQFDASAVGIFTTMAAKFNQWAENGAGGIKGILADLLKVGVDKKTDVSTNKFKKGPIPFDGITKQAIVEVIPGHLRRIEAALTGSSERIYDMQSGQWTSIKDLEKRYKDRQESAYQLPFYEIASDLKSYINDLRKTDKDKAEAYQEAMEKIMKQVYKDGGFFAPFRSSIDDIGEKQTPAEYYDVDPEIYKEIIPKLVGTIRDPKTGKRVPTRDSIQRIMNLSKNVMRERESYSGFLREIESGDESTLQNLFNGAYKVNLGIDSKYDENKRISPFSNLLVNAVDQDKKNIFFYLRGIYSELIAKRLNGSRNGGITRNNSSIILPSYVNSTVGQISPEDALQIILNSNNTSLNITDDDNSNNTNEEENSEDNQFIREYLKAKKEEEEKLGKKGVIAKNKDKFVTQMMDAEGIGGKFKVIKNNIDYWLNKPSAILATILEKADRQVFSMLFGEEEMLDMAEEEENHKTPKGMIDLAILKIQETFDNLNDWLDENIFDPLKNKLGVESLGDFFKKIGDTLGITEPIKSAIDWIKEKRDDVISAIGSKFKWAGSEFSGSMSRTYGAAIRAVEDINKKNKKPKTQYVESEDTPTEFDDEEVETNARGKFITKRGLAVVSPGETIIPATWNKKGQDKQLKKEKDYARRFGIKTNNYFASGTDSPSGVAQYVDAEENKDAVQSTFKKVMSEVGTDTSIIDIIANSLIGGGASLITGMIGGPLLGAAAGAGIGMIKQSETLQEKLFGERDKEGNRKGGIISKDIQDWFKKYFPSIKDFGLAGAVASLFTPLGLVGGLAVGGTVGYLKKNNKFQEYLFGKDIGNNERDNSGLISNEFRKQLKKAAPRMLVGAVGGALFGPFGLLGNAAMGSAIGYLSTTDEFHKTIFGEKQSDGTTKGGLLNALKDGFVKPVINFGKNLVNNFTDCFDKKILKPMKNFTKPFTQMIKNGIIEIVDSIKDHYKETIGRPLADFIHHNVLEPVGRMLKFLLKGPAAIAKGLISAPFQALGFIGNNMTMSQIRKGTATNMSASERVKWRQDHPIRALSPDRVLRNDKFGNIDRMLSTQYEGKEGVEKLKSLREDIKIVLNVKKEMGARIAKNVKDAGDKLSDILNSSIMEDPTTGQTVSVYTYVRGKNVTKLFKAISNGNLNEALKEINTGRWKDVPADIKAEVEHLLRTVMPSIADAIKAKNDVEGTKKGTLAKISKATGSRITNNKDLRRLYRNIDAEIDFKESKTDAEIQAEVAASLNDDMKKKLEAESSKIQRCLASCVEIIKGVEVRLSENGEIHRLTNVRNEAIRNTGNTYLDDDDTEDEFYLPGDEYYNANPNARLEYDDTPSTGQRNKGRVRKYISKLYRDTLGRIPDKFSEMKRNARSGFNAGQEATKNAIDKYGIKEVGGVLLGRKSEMLKYIKKGYHVTTTTDGKMCLSTADGKMEGDMAKEITAEEAEKFKRTKEITEALKITSKGITGLATGILGKGWQLGKSVVGGFLNTINDAIDSTGFVGKILKGVVKGAVFVAAAGHLAKFWTESIWKPIVVPFWNDTLWPAIKGIGSNLYNWVSENFPKVGEMLSGIKDNVTKLIENPADTVINWFTTGWKNAWDYIAKPLGTLIWNAIHVDDYPKFESSIASEKKYTYTNDEGEQVESSYINYEDQNKGIISRVLNGQFSNFNKSGTKTISENSHGNNIEINGIKYGIQKYSDGSFSITRDTDEIYIIVYPPKTDGIIFKNKKWRIQRMGPMIDDIVTYNADTEQGKKLAIEFGVRFDANMTKAYWPAFNEADMTYTNIMSQTTSASSNSTRGTGFKNTTSVNIEGHSRSGKGHIYQKAAEIANKKFGKSTIGEAGCGPVAATNLINKLGGNMDINNAASYAETGGFIDPNTGGTTTDYFSSILNKTGIGGRESTNKTDIYNSLKNNNPVVMLGQSKSENGTPFGSGSHYINAMGMDRNGNIIAEDPDLPQSYVSYKASQVLNDMDAGIITGFARKRKGRSRRKFFGFRRSGRGNSIKIPAWVAKAYSIISAREGGYDSVNVDDNGSMSIGRIQMHGNNARNILQEIFNAVIADNTFTSSQIINLVGQSLYNDVMNGADFSKRKATSKEAAGLKKILGTETAKAAQDIHYLNRIYGYYTNSAKKKGINDSTQENVVIFFCDMYNQSPKAAVRVLENSISRAGSASSVTLDLIYQVSISDSTFSKYSKRRGIVYQELAGSTPAGTSITEYDYNNVVDYVEQSDDTLSSIISSISNSITNAFTSIYGENLTSLLGIGSSSSTASGQDGSITVGSWNGVASEGQKSVVSTMASKLGQLRYSLKSGEQDPDKGSGSCASTVGWAYRKALGVTGMSASSATQSKDSRFSTIWTKKTGSDKLDTSILQPGDVIYYNWNRENAANNGDMKHTEMYAGSNQDLSHGGGSNGQEYGPTYKPLDKYRKSTAMMVRRYTPFLSGSGRSDLSKMRSNLMSGKAAGTDPNQYISSHGIPEDYSSYVNRAQTSYNQGTISYEQFLNVIIELLTIIAKNSDNQILILKTLQKNNINIDPNDIKEAGQSRSARERIKRNIRSGFSRIQTDQNNSSQSNNSDQDIQYIIKMMESLARS